MYKRLLALAASCLLVLSAVSCGKPESPDNSGGETTVPTTAASVSENAEPTAEEPLTTTEAGSEDPVPTQPDAGTQPQPTEKTTAGTGTAKPTAKPKPGSRGSISWWTEYPGGGAMKHLDKALGEFEEKSGIKVDIFIQDMTGGTITPFDDKFIPAMSAGNGPDVCIFGRVDPKYMVDITDKLEKSFWDEFFPSVRDKFSAGGRYYSTPTFMSIGGLLLYSKVDFKNAGLDPNAPPRTIAELDKMADKLFIKNKAGTGYDQVGFYPWFWLMMHYPDLLTRPFGGGWWNDEGYPTANHPGNIEAMEWVLKYVDKYGYDKVNNSLSKLVNEKNMYGHALAMNMSFGAQISNFVGNGIDLSEWGIAPFPGKDSKHSGLSIGLASGYGVVKGTKKVDEVVEFMKFMSTDYQKKYVSPNYEDYESYSCNQKGWEANVGKMDRFTKILYNDILAKATARDINSNIQKVKYTTPATYSMLMKDSISKIINGEVEIRAELDALQKKIAARTKES